MSSPGPLHAFAGYGIELEYMIVDRQTLSILPIADELLHQIAGHCVSDLEQGTLAWSNELVLHLVELKNARPDPALESLPAAFQAEIRRISRLLEPMGARLMPGAMHPWMNPLAETRLWPHDNAIIYQTYDHIFDCRRHGWANLQSMHLNLPFAMADDGDEFARLHAAIRLVLPILPALAASSPIAEGGSTGFLDFRMEAYRTHQMNIPSSIGRVIPDTVTSRSQYETQVLAPMYRDIAAYDPQGVLRHEWLNARGAVARFDRNAVEIRVIDLQECPQADLAIASAAAAAVRALYDFKWSALSAQQGCGTEALTQIMLSCIRDADEAVIDDTEYLRLLGFPGRRCMARELWRHLIEATSDHGKAMQESLRVILDQGPLARRILQAVGPDFSRAHLREVYRQLCDCLEEGRMFAGLDR